MSGARFAFVLLPAILCLHGCGPNAGSPASSDGGALETKRVPADRLPIGGLMPPMDDGRVVLAPPQDWYVAPRRRGYVVQFYRDKTRQVRIPRVWVTVEVSPFDDLETAGVDQLQQFTQRVAERLDADGITLIEPVRPMVIGSTPCVRYVRQTIFTREKGGKKERMTAERQVLEILVDGRLYTVDLHVPSRKMLAYRDAGYAVAASMQFPNAGEGGSSQRPNAPEKSDGPENPDGPEKSDSRVDPETE